MKINFIKIIKFINLQKILFLSFKNIININNPVLSHRFLLKAYTLKDLPKDPEIPRLTAKDFLLFFKTQSFGFKLMCYIIACSLLQLSIKNIFESIYTFIYFRRSLIYKVFNQVFELENSLLKIKNNFIKWILNGIRKDSLYKNVYILITFIKLISFLYNKINQIFKAIEKKTLEKKRIAEQKKIEYEKFRRRRRMFGEELPPFEKQKENNYFINSLKNLYAKILSSFSKFWLNLLIQLLKKCGLYYYLKKHLKDLTIEQIIAFFFISITLFNLINYAVMEICSFSTDVPFYYSKTQFFPKSSSPFASQKVFVADETNTLFPISNTKYFDQPLNIQKSTSAVPFANNSNKSFISKFENSSFSKIDTSKNSISWTLKIKNNFEKSKKIDNKVEYSLTNFYPIVKKVGKRKISH